MSDLVRQASGVALGGRGLLIEGVPGSGKSSLALALIDRGASLIGDDGVTLTLRDGRVWAEPPPRIGGLLEIRNVGLVAMDACAAPLALVVRLDPAAERLPESPGAITVLGHTVPLIALWPGSPVLALRTEHAMRVHGLP